MSTIKTYKELVNIPTFEGRYEYLKLSGKVGEDTFGFNRYLNQIFYRSDGWKKVRREVILRDDGCDLATPGYIIPGNVFVHHMNPITMKDLEHKTDLLLDPDYLICVSFDTHNAIHYGDDSRIIHPDPVVRKPGDTCLWRI